MNKKLKNLLNKTLCNLVQRETGITVTYFETDETVQMGNNKRVKLTDDVKKLLIKEACYDWIPRESGNA